MAREDILCDKYPTEKYNICERAEMCTVNIPGSGTACPTTLVCVYTQPSTSNTTLTEQLKLLYDDIRGDEEQQALIVGETLMRMRKNEPQLTPEAKLHMSSANLEVYYNL